MGLASGDIDSDAAHDAAGKVLGQPAPGLPPLRGFDAPPLLVGPPEVSHGGDENRLGMMAVDEDPADVARFPKAHIRPGPASIRRLVDAVAYGHAVPAGGL